MARDEWSDFYGAEAETYEAARYGSKYGRAFRQAHGDRVRELVQAIPGSVRVLDVASGTGQMLSPLRDHASAIVACDLTPEMLLVSRRIHYSVNSISYCQADALKLPFADRSFDLVVSSRFLHLFPEDAQQRLLKEMARVLRPRGMVMVDFYNVAPRRLLAGPIRLYRRLTRKRPERDYYASFASAHKALEASGIAVNSTHGVGSYFAAPLLWLPQSILASLLNTWPFTGEYLAEQFIVVGSNKSCD